MRQFDAVKVVGFNLFTVMLLNETVEINEKQASREYTPRS